MKNLAAIFLFGVALVALCGSFAGTRRGAGQVQFAPQTVKVVNTPNDGGYIPVANERAHPLYVVAESGPAAAAPPTYVYKAVPFSPELETGLPDAPPKIDQTKLAGDLEVFLDRYADWDVVSVPATFSVGPNMVVFRRRK